MRAAVRGLADAPGLEFLRPRPVRIVGRETRTEEVDVSPAGLLLRAEAVGGNSGEIEVLRLGEPGSRAWVVIIPGTQLDGLPQGTNPFDAAGIAEGLGYDSAETAAAIRQALAEAGAEAGDQVAAVGYSQGGIHAMNLGRDKAFLADYELKFVLTAGSPVGGIEPGPGISSLHLEHEQDWVPGADGTAQPGHQGPGDRHPDHSDPRTRMAGAGDGAGPRHGALRRRRPGRRGEPGSVTAGLDRRARRRGRRRRDGHGDPVLAPARSHAGTAGSARRSGAAAAWRTARSARRRASGAS